MRALLFLACATFLAPVSSGAVGGVYESFEDGWGAWAVDDDVWCFHVEEPCAWRREAQLAPGVAFDGAWSVLVQQEGIHDSGAVWVERLIPVPVGERVEVAFWVASALLGPMTAWEVRAYAGVDDPESEFDLVRVGPLDDLPGWHRYCLAVDAPAAETMWVAGGVRAAWESGPRVHAIDLVSVRGITGGEPCGILEDPCHLAAAACAGRSSCELAACAQRPT